MKKCTLLLGMVWCVSLALFAQDNQTETTEKKGIHPWKTAEYAGKQGSWSISVEGGTNLFTGDIQQSFKNLFPRSKWRPTWGVGVEYSINPVWGVALHYNHAPYYTTDSRDSNTELSGVMNSIELLATIDLIDLWFPKRPKNIFSLYLLAGGGIGFFNCEVTNPNGLQSNGMTSYNGKEFGTSAGATGTSNKDITGIFPVGFAIEFNISRMFAIGAKGVFNWNWKDNLDSWVFSEPIRGGVYSDFIEYMTVNLRWKMPSRKADHKRNWREPESMFTPCDHMKKQEPDTVVVIYKPEVDTIYVVVSQNQPEEIGKMPKQPATSIPAPTASVYFDISSSILKDDALIVIHSIATQMEADTTLCLEIRGYCDNTASDTYNMKLSKQRAESVKNELVSVWKIAPERIITEGYGIIAEPPKSYKPNRRVDFRFISRQEADALTGAQGTACTDVSFDESRTYTKFLATHQVKENDTLYKLAQKYYGSAILWVYIYEANRETIQQPDRINADMKIKIPSLPAELTDMNNPASAEYAKQLEKRYTQK